MGLVFPFLTCGGTYNRTCSEYLAYGRHATNPHKISMPTRASQFPFVDEETEAVQGDTSALKKGWVWNQVTVAPPFQSSLSWVRPCLVRDVVHVRWCYFYLTFVKHFIGDKSLWPLLK